MARKSKKSRALVKNAPKRLRQTKAPIKRRNYEAAKNSDLFGAWGVGNATADALLQTSLTALRARSRDLERNYSIIKRFKTLVINNVVGADGFRLNVTADEKAAATIEEKFAEFSASCDVTGKYSLRQFLSVAIGSVVIDGEVLIRRVKNYDNPFGYALQLIEADHLVETLNDKQRNIKMGVEYNDWGKPIAYHLYKHHPGEYSSLSQEIIRVEAEEIIHLFIQDRISQSRGVPWMHSVMTDMKMLKGYEEAELVAARLGAAKGGFYIKPAGDQFEDSEGNSGDDVIQEVTPGMFEILPDGWDFKQFDPTHPTTAFKDFEKKVLQTIASGLNVSYHNLANDLEGVNYSSIRSGVLEERSHWIALQQWLIERVLKPVYEDFLTQAMLYGVLDLPFSKLKKYKKSTFMGRRWAWVDPLKDMQANILAIKAGLKSPSMVANEMGYEIEDVYAKIQKDQKLREKFGITTMSDAELLDLLKETNDANTEEQ